MSVLDPPAGEICGPDSTSGFDLIAAGRVRRHGERRGVVALVRLTGRVLRSCAVGVT